ncbi:MAG: hypothetical protein O9325_19555 [Roseomonas sp.]|nr:hypothetical protein [Roseomonas sp.]
MLIHRQALPAQRRDANAIAAFERDGFVVTRGVVPPKDLVPIRALHDQMFESSTGWERGELFDMVDPEDRPDAAQRDDAGALAAAGRRAGVGIRHHEAAARWRRDSLAPG